MGEKTPKYTTQISKKLPGIRLRGPIPVQDFNGLRQKCLSEGRLFEDPEFPAQDSSLFYSERPDIQIEWKRPKEIVKNPQLFVEGYSRFDVEQGYLGDCWFLAAVANISMHSNLFMKIVPEDQSFEENYAGIFHFRFWQFGRWVEVVIDDRLPTYGGKLIYLKSAEPNEFWSALLEKAYAKLHGSYGALEGGIMCEALEDFTGGVSEMYALNNIPPNFFNILLEAYERNSLMGCSIEPHPSEDKTPEGLIREHSYSITCVKLVNISTPYENGIFPLLRLRNPWGNEAEWNGAWSDTSPVWRFVSDHEKEKLGLTFDADGEFWMSFPDCMRYFTSLEICHLIPDSLTDDDLNKGKKKWEMSAFEGKWVRGITAGGPNNFSETFSQNPQYRITLKHPDEDDDECTIVVALMQKLRVTQNRAEVDSIGIGFAIYRLENPDKLPKTLDGDFFMKNMPVAGSSEFTNLRQSTYRFTLPPGTYAIVPCTYKPNDEGEFLLRIFSENQNNTKENDDEVGIDEWKLDHNEKKLRELFRKLAGDDKEIDWMELNKLMGRAMHKNINNERFLKDVCRCIVARLDVDHSGKLGFEEFKAMCNEMGYWRAVFELYDNDDSVCLQAFELRQALNSAGYQLNNRIQNILVQRYCNCRFSVLLATSIVAGLRNPRVNKKKTAKRA